MTYKATGYPEDNSPFSAPRMRGEFKAIETAFAGSVSTQMGVSGGLWAATVQSVEQNRYHLATIADVGDLSGGYGVGQQVWFVPTAANTGDCTVSVNGGPANFVRNAENGALNGGELNVGGIVGLVFDGAYWRIVANQRGANPVGTTFEDLRQVVQSGAAVDVWAALVEDDSWQRYDDLVFTLGQYVSIIPVAVIRDSLEFGVVGEMPDQSELGIVGIDVFGSSIGGDVPSVVVIRDINGGLDVAYGSQRDADGFMKVSGRTYAHMIPNSVQRGWTPQFRWVRNTQTNSSYWLEVDWIGGDAPKPQSGLVTTGDVVGPSSSRLVSGVDGYEPVYTFPDEGLGAFPDRTYSQLNLDHPIVEVDHMREHGLLVLNFTPGQPDADNYIRYDDEDYLKVFMPNRAEISSNHLAGVYKMFNATGRDAALHYTDHNDREFKDSAYIEIPDGQVMEFAAIENPPNDGYYVPIGSNQYVGTISTGFERLQPSLSANFYIDETTEPLLSKRVGRIHFKGSVADMKKCYLVLSEAASDLIISNFSTGTSGTIYVINSGSTRPTSGDPSGNAVEIPYGNSRRVVTKDANTYALVSV